MTQFPAENTANFFHLIRFSHCPIERIDVRMAMHILQTYLDSDLNNHTYDLVNYELLYYIECQFPNHPEISAMIADIKHRIADNFIYRQKLINRHLIDL